MSFRRAGVGLALAIALTAIYAVWLRRADLRAFDPAGTAWLETAIWRNDYDKRHAGLFY
ncbi:hypothetical protein QA640_22285 [Bradyrhizobium sp. CB82]|uniref:hypothetical protein n=1 Tax=Bradyrhizobium sp. CB82 TaxID=3039159 RepID=UPI0024B25C99|nr:hypothetical protein [Bradyrhizobium sp. CB82]WFU44947.1 hypothetical protein QA640_22285 [Bradyrhizobium sp. CB82]